MKRLTTRLADRCQDALASLAMLALMSGCMLALGGCGSVPAQPAAKADNSTDIRGALLVIRLSERLEPPATVQVEVAPAAGGPLTSLSARRQQSVPGARADYFVALALAPQAYLITAIREGSTNPNAPGETLAAPNLPFEVKPGVPAYLGRLVLTPDAAISGSLDAQDHYDEDTLFFRTALPALRELAIPRDVLVLANAPRAPSGRQLSMDTMDASATTSTLRGPARDAFLKYMKTKAPRAFAINEADNRSFAYFSGERAVERALKECSRRAGAGVACRLYAVDDTVVSSFTTADGAGKPP